MAQVKTTVEVLRRMGVHLETEPEPRATMPVVPAVCSAPGLVRAGALASLADCVVGLHSTPMWHPDWTVTADLYINGLGLVASTAEVASTAALVKRRRTGGVYQAELREVDSAGVLGGHLGLCTTTFATIPAAADAPLLEAVEDAETDPAAVIATELAHLIDPEIVDGRLQLAIDPASRNPFGVLSGGVLALLVELAGEQVGAAELGEDTTVTDLGLQYLSPARQGPIWAEAKLLHRYPDAATSRVTLRDAGDDDRVVVTGTATAWRRSTLVPPA